ncbi:serine hydrolase [Clostridium omnivorum]|uniref:Serine hydrolase n=1 Tax=Clostridium omnivorum TaxID=1604902 RepID=A0ABQ5NA35_9CLOT|nr:serine hydrolase [Clostridium sp. E14]GLC32066.1 serine hydrolase [Clostridium sp. E14]
MKEIKRYLDNCIGEYSFYFEDILSGYTYSFNEKNIMPSASLIKLPIAISLMKEVELGKISLKDKVEISKEEMVDGSGIIHEFDERMYSINELLIAMLIQSDNTAANKLIELLGMNKINEYIKTMGLKDTVLKRKMMDYAAREKGLENLTTAYDMSSLFKALHNSTYLICENSKFLLDILKRQQIRDKIPFYMPMREWSNIANKTGTLDGIENDSSLITISKGNFVFTVMSKSLPNNVYGVVTISRVGKMMWDIIDRNWKKL